MEKSRVTAGLQTIPRLSGVMSRKVQHAQTSCHQPGILATLGHTKHVPLLRRHSVHQGVEASLLQEDLDLPDNQIMVHLVAMVVIRHIAQVDLQDMGLEYPLGPAVAPKDSDHQCRMGALDYQGIMKVLDHLAKMLALNHLDKVEAWDHQVIMEGLDHLDKMGNLVHQGKMEVLDH